MLRESTCEEACVYNLQFSLPSTQILLTYMYIDKKILHSKKDIPSKNDNSLTFRILLRVSVKSIIIDAAIFRVAFCILLYYIMSPFPLRDIKTISTITHI